MLMKGTTGLQRVTASPSLRTVAHAWPTDRGTSREQGGKPGVRAEVSFTLHYETVSLTWSPQIRWVDWLVGPRELPVLTAPALGL